MTNISTLGQQMNLIARMKDIQGNMSHYQQQVTSGVKHQTFAGYGVESLKIQRYRSGMKELEAYGYNISNAQMNIRQMNETLAENTEQARNILDAIGVQLSRGEEFDLATIKQAAHTALQVIEANVNVEVGGRYLFAGSDVTNKPLNGADGAANNMALKVTDWMDGTVDTEAFLASFDALSDSESGFSGTVQTAKNVYARADDNYEVDYTVKANSSGMKQILNGLRMISQLEFPADSDVASKDDFYDVVDHLYKTVQSGVTDLRADSAKLANATAVLSNIKTNHDNDMQSMQTLMEETEAADPTDAIIKFQTLQTQLEASYNITSIVSQLSLARFLGG